MLYDGKATRPRLRIRPLCDICGYHPAIADGKTSNGPWGYLCEEHFEELGLGLGLGVGQILLCGDDMDERLIATYLVNMRLL